jgi:hypothetical protein
MFINTKFTFTLVIYKIALILYHMFCENSEEAKVIHSLLCVMLYLKTIYYIYSSSFQK